MIALVLLLRYSLLLLGFGRSPFCKRKRDERERESKGGESFFFGCDYDVFFVCSFFLFLFLFVLVLVFVLSRAKGQKSDGSRWRRRRRWSEERTLCAT